MALLTVALSAGHIFRVVLHGVSPGNQGDNQGNFLIHISQKERFAAAGDFFFVQKPVGQGLKYIIMGLVCFLCGV